MVCVPCKNAGSQGKVNSQTSKGRGKEQGARICPFLREERQDRCFIDGTEKRKKGGLPERKTAALYPMERGTLWSKGPKKTVKKSWAAFWEKRREKRTAIAPQRIGKKDAEEFF